jgi:hypothetical protein
MQFPGKQFLKRRLFATVAREAGLHLIDDHDASDVFFVGFPKSGHTWVQYLIASLFGADVRHCPDALVHDLVPDVHDRRFYRRYSTPMVFKSHALPQPDYRRVIYLLRDGRDVMVSYYHHACVRFGSQDWNHFVGRPPGLNAKWHEHVETWLANPYDAELLILRYEDLKRDAPTELRRICSFLGRTEPDARIQEVVSSAAFEIMQAREKKIGWEDPTWPKEKAFVRRGAVGSFRDEMPAPALALFLAESGPILKRLGYLT